MVFKKYRKQYPYYKLYIGDMDDKARYDALHGSIIITIILILSSRSARFQVSM